MNYADKMALVQQANERRGAISDAKGPEYAGQAGRYQDDDVDVLANFKRQDVRWGFDTGGLASAFVYFGKHIDSIETFAREVIAALQTDEQFDAIALSNMLARGEGFISRLDDARNYLDLIECLIQDLRDTLTEEFFVGYPQGATLGGGFTPAQVVTYDDFRVGSIIEINPGGMRVRIVEVEQGKIGVTTDLEGKFEGPTLVLWLDVPGLRV